MKYLDRYLKKISDRGNIKMADSIKQTADDVGEKYIKSFSFSDHEIGLLFGNVQSGKTGQMFGIICKATDLGFPVFVILTTDNSALQQQTLDRVRLDLDGYCICDENDAGLFKENNLVLPAIIVLKKNARILKLWSNILGSTGFMKGNPLFIIDDEADAASLNTLVNRNKQSTINKYLDNIKSKASSSIYLQVTGTPQAIFLQTSASGWHPYFTYYFQPGDSYLGGDFFFPGSQKPKCISFLETIPDPMMEVIVRHLAVSAQILETGGKVSNCLFHPGVKIAEHEKYSDDIRKVLTWCVENIDQDFPIYLKKQYDNLNPLESDKISFDRLLLRAKEILIDNKYKVLIMNGKSYIESTEYSRGCNFIIGGNTLGRGITFPNLQTICYTRTSKNPQADTMWQHSRMFGYDRDPGMMMVYMDEYLYKLFADINATNNSIISQVQLGTDVKIYYPKGLNPTRKNVLDNKHLEILSGNTNYFPSDPDNDSIETITNILKPFSESEASYQVSLKLINEILSHIIPSPDFKLSAIISAINAIIAENPAGQGILIVRKNRDVTQGTGALLSPTDRELGNSFSKNTVLTMYQVTGTRGWKKESLWVPNIKLPENIMYYDVCE